MSTRPRRSATSKPINYNLDKDDIEELNPSGEPRRRSARRKKKDGKEEEKGRTEEVPETARRFNVGASVRVFCKKTKDYYAATVEAVKETEDGPIQYDVLYQDDQRLEQGVNADRISALEVDKSHEEEQPLTEIGEKRRSSRKRSTICYNDDEAFSRLEQKAKREKKGPVQAKKDTLVDLVNDSDKAESDAETGVSSGKKRRLKMGTKPDPKASNFYGKNKPEPFLKFGFEKGVDRFKSGRQMAEGIAPKGQKNKSRKRRAKTVDSSSDDSDENSGSDYKGDDIFDEIELSQTPGKERNCKKTMRKSKGTKKVKPSKLQMEKDSSDASENVSDSDFETNGTKDKKSHTKKATKGSKKTKKKNNASKKAGKPAADPERKSERARKPTTTYLERTEDDSDMVEEVSEGEEQEAGSAEEDPLRIEVVLGRKEMTRAAWRELCGKMHTKHVERGSMWHQPEDLWASDSPDLVEKFLIKWQNFSYLHVSWEEAEDLIPEIGPSAKGHLRKFLQRENQYNAVEEEEKGDGEFFDPVFLQVDRILYEFSEDEDEDERGTKLESENSNAEESISKMEVDCDDKHTSGGEDLSGESAPVVDLSHSEHKCESEKVENEENKENSVEESDSVAKAISTKEGEIVVEKPTSSQKAKSEITRSRKYYVVKWADTPYSEATEETEEDIKELENFTFALESYRAREEKPKMKNQLGCKRDIEDKKDRGGLIQKKLAEKAMNGVKTTTTYKNGGQLRDYQVDGVNWMVFNWFMKRNSILADEMGLGKTVQTSIFLHTIHKEWNFPGPFLIVAPLSTIPHWQREFEGWTDFNTVVFHGLEEDRKNIVTYELFYDEPTSRKINKSNVKADVVITTPEMCINKDSRNLYSIPWSFLVIDEAHRIKNDESRLAITLREEFSYGQHPKKHNECLLLTGTPLQNNTQELWTLLNFIDPKKFEDKEEFVESYGDLKDESQLKGLKESMKAYFLRRMKEDVEKSVPPKEETIIEVELTKYQKQYYRALFERNIVFLARGKRAVDTPSLMNMAMELRKCCNHPYLIRGAEEDLIEMKLREGNDTSEVDMMVNFSGKLVLLDKLLPRLKEGGHRVLLFSQFKIMLDIIEDYLHGRGFIYSRIDGSITGRDRQAAIDKFCAKDSNAFIMLLSTKAGGVGINLTAADTCIIFDSDWNPQNDLQAQARCHRIGQTKNVQVYRLITRKTYEQQMFHQASLKLGLDHAVLHSIQGDTANDGQKPKALTKNEVESLLRHGVYDVFDEANDGEAEQDRRQFEEADIDQILQKSVTLRFDENKESGNKTGFGFSKASFVTSNNDEVAIDDPDFWKKVVSMKNIQEEIEQLKERKARSGKKNYNVDAKNLDAGSDFEEFEDEDEEEKPRKKKSQKVVVQGKWFATARNAVVNTVLGGGVMIKPHELRGQSLRHYGHNFSKFNDEALQKAVLGYVVECMKVHAHALQKLQAHSLSSFKTHTMEFTEPGPLGFHIGAGKPPLVVNRITDWSQGSEAERKILACFPTCPSWRLKGKIIVLMKVNEQDVSTIPLEEVLSLIAGSRPLRIQIAARPEISYDGTNEGPFVDPNSLHDKKQLKEYCLKEVISQFPICKEVVKQISQFNIDDEKLSPDTWRITEIVESFEAPDGFIDDKLSESLGRNSGRTAKSKLQQLQNIHDVSQLSRDLKNGKAVKELLGLTKYKVADEESESKQLIKVFFGFKQSPPETWWSVEHDICLIHAAAKHGWIGIRVRHQDMENDKSIDWPKPMKGAEFDWKELGSLSTRLRALVEKSCYRRPIQEQEHQLSCSEEDASFMILQVCHNSDGTRDLLEHLARLGTPPTIDPPSAADWESQDVWGAMQLTWEKFKAKMDPPSSKDIDEFRREATNILQKAKGIKSKVQTGSPYSRYRSNVNTYLQRILEIDSLRDVLVKGDMRQMEARAHFLSNSSKPAEKLLPHWWAPEHDAELLKGFFLHGTDLKKILDDSRLNLSNEKCELKVDVENASHRLYLLRRSHERSKSLNLDDGYLPHDFDPKEPFIRARQGLLIQGYKAEKTWITSMCHFSETDWLQGYGLPLTNDRPLIQPKGNPRTLGYAQGLVFKTFRNAAKILEESKDWKSEDEWGAMQLTWKKLEDKGGIRGRKGELQPGVNCCNLTDPSFRMRCEQSVSRIAAVNSGFAVAEDVTKWQDAYRNIKLVTDLRLQLLSDNLESMKAAISKLSGVLENGSVTKSVEMPSWWDKTCDFKLLKGLFLDGYNVNQGVSRGTCLRVKLEAPQDELPFESFKGRIVDLHQALLHEGSGSVFEDMFDPPKRPTHVNNMELYTRPWQHLPTRLVELMDKTYLQGKKSTPEKEGNGSTSAKLSLLSPQQQPSAKVALLSPQRSQAGPRPMYPSPVPMPQMHRQLMSVHQAMMHSPHRPRHSTIVPSHHGAYHHHHGNRQVPILPAPVRASVNGSAAPAKSKEVMPIEILEDSSEDDGAVVASSASNSTDVNENLPAEKKTTPNETEVERTELRAKKDVSRSSCLGKRTIADFFQKVPREDDSSTKTS